MTEPTFHEVYAERIRRGEEAAGLRPRRCAQMIQPRGRFYMPVPPHRCTRKALPGSKFCRQHSK